MTSVCQIEKWHWINHTAADAPVLVHDSNKIGADRNVYSIESDSDVEEILSQLLHFSRKGKFICESSDKDSAILEMIKNLQPASNWLISGNNAGWERKN